MCTSFLGFINARHLLASSMRSHHEHIAVQRVAGMEHLESWEETDETCDTNNGESNNGRQDSRLLSAFMATFVYLCDK